MVEMNNEFSKKNHKKNPLIRFIIRSCLTTLLVLGLIGVLWYYPNAVKDLGPSYGVDTITNAFFVAVIGIVLAIMLVQLYSRFWRPGRIESTINRHVDETLQKHAKQGKAH